MQCVYLIVIWNNTKLLEISFLAFGKHYYGLMTDEAKLSLLQLPLPLFYAFVFTTSWTHWMTSWYCFKSLFPSKKSGKFTFLCSVGMLTMGHLTENDA